MIEPTIILPPLNCNAVKLIPVLGVSGCAVVLLKHFNDRLLHFLSKITYWNYDDYRSWLFGFNFTFAHDVGSGRSNYLFSPIFARLSVKRVLDCILSRAGNHSSVFLFISLRGRTVVLSPPRRPHLSLGSTYRPRWAVVSVIGYFVCHPRFDPGRWFL